MPDTQTGYIRFSDFFGGLCALSDYRFNMVQLYQHTLVLEADVKRFSIFCGLFSDGMVILPQFTFGSTLTTIGPKLDGKNLRSW